MQVELIDCSCRHPAAASESKPAVRSVSLKVRSGEQIAVIGPSGAGKTTLLQLLCCALKPSEGRFLLDDKNPWQVSKSELTSLRRRLFLAPQVPPLPPRQRVVTSVLAGRLPSMGFWKSMRSLFYPIGIKDAREALAQYDLAEKLFERVDRLSGGERQRVGLARGLVSNAQLFLIDEPLSALDPARATIAMKALTGSAASRGATLIATLHQVDTALKYFPRVVGMRDGEVFFDLPVQEVSKGLLEELYAHHLDELEGPAPEIVYPPSQQRPVPMQCR